MSVAVRVALTRTAAVLGAAMAVLGSVAAVGTDQIGLWTEWGGDFAGVYAVLLAALVLLAVRGHPDNAVIGVLAVSAFFFGAYAAAGGAALRVVDPGVLLDGAGSPADLAPFAAWLMAIVEAGWIPPMFMLLTVGLLLFPDGRLPSPRWRWLAGFSVTLIVVATVGTAWDHLPSSSLPYGETSTLDDYLMVGAWIVMGTVLLSLSALVRRFRASSGEARQQFRWVTWGAALLAIGLTVAFVLDDTPYQPVSDTMLYLGGAGLLVSYGIAVGKYRLYDIDLVISRTFVYGSLAVFITGVYVGAVLGVGGLIGGDAQTNPWLAIGATALVAFAFEPIRGRLQRLANRMVFGRRATPYEVLSEFSQKITTGDETLLKQVAHSLVEGTTAEKAAVWMMGNEELISVAVWPENGDGLSRRAVPDITFIPDVDLTRPVVHDGETLGALTLTIARGQSALTADERLLDHLASALGLALRNIRLGDHLRRQIDELSRSRSRLVSIQDETRRHLEREVHDGAQQRLVALKVKLALAKRQADTAGIADVANLLDQVTDDTDKAVDALRDFALGIYPPLLQAEGLETALSSQAQTLPIPVTVHAAGVGRQPAPVETAVYFCVLEALQNVVKHADASSAHVALHRADGTLTFEVSDNGKGFDPARIEVGSGLRNLADRIEVLDGIVEVASAQSQGTTIRGTIPLRVEEPVV